MTAVALFGVVVDEILRFVTSLSHLGFKVLLVRIKAVSGVN